MNLFKPKKPIQLRIELEDFQPIRFEPISNQLTHGNIKEKNLLV
jgi:hypothetical protein